MNINLSDEMFETLVDACEQAAYVYEELVQILNHADETPRRNARLATVQKKLRNAIDAIEMLKHFKQ